MKKFIENGRFLALIAVVELLVMSAVAFTYNAVQGGELVIGLVTRQDIAGLFSLYLIKLVDGILIAIVLLMLSMSVYSMFIGTLEVPSWMVARNLQELKTKLSGVIILVLAVRFLEYVLEGELASIDVLWTGIAIAAVIAALVAFSVFTEK